MCGRLSLLVIFIASFTSNLAFRGDHRSPWTVEELERCYRAPNCYVIDGVPVIDDDHPLTIEARQSSEIVTNLVASEGIVNTATCDPYDIVHGTLVRIESRLLCELRTPTVPVQSLSDHGLLT